MEVTTLPIVATPIPDVDISLPVDISPWRTITPSIHSLHDFPPLGATVPFSQNNNDNNIYVDDLTQEEKDRILALELQDEFNRLDQNPTAPQQLQTQKKIPDVKPAATVDDDNKEDEDYKLALKLQEELNNAEEKDLPAYDNTKNHNRPNSKQPTSDILPFSFKVGKGDYSNDYDENELDEQDSDEDYDDEDDEDESYENSQLDKGQREIITKHDSAMSKAGNSFKLEDFHSSAGNLKDLGISNSVYNSLRKDSKRADYDKAKIQNNKKDKSSHDSVVDASTRMLLFKMLNSNFLQEFNGIVSVGKEAHVYHGIGGENPDIPSGILGAEYAIKIFSNDNKTFKDRSMYLESSKGMPTKNNKTIKLWAEKEMRNLRRMNENGILCPIPILLRRNIIVMTFLGKNGVPAPRLKDANIPSINRLHELYIQCAKMIRKLYQEAKVVHADLSEYNILYHKHKLWFIDVSQAVERDHSNAEEFLKRDCATITKFFTNKGVTTVSTKHLVSFVTEPNLAPEDLDNYLKEYSDGGDEEEEINEDERKED